jgi:hypothetical protein
VEFYSSVAQPKMAFVLFFCSRQYDLDVLGLELRRLFGDVPVLGCTSAGEIGPGGYQEGNLVGASFAVSDFAVSVGCIDNLQDFRPSECQELGFQLLQRLSEQVSPVSGRNCFALTLIDGMSRREEPVARALQNVLGNIQMAGGSAGGGLSFNDTLVNCDGCFRTGRVAVALVATTLPFTVFKTQHFVPGDRRMVITEADSSRREVIEIDGLPAAQEYARMLGIHPRDLTPKCFAASPVVVVIAGDYYVRSIQKADPDGRLTLFCAIERGVVLRNARSMDIVENLKTAFERVRAQIGPPQLTIAFDCFLRRFEVHQNRLEDRVGELLRANQAIGLNTYGEQFRGVHVNQTFTSIAIGSRTSGVPHG